MTNLFELVIQREIGHRRENKNINFIIGKLWINMRKGTTNVDPILVYLKYFKFSLKLILNRLFKKSPSQINKIKNFSFRKKFGSAEDRTLNWQVQTQLRYHLAK